MTGPLALRVVRMPGESPQSFMSRLAARNGVDLLEFGRDMLLPPVRVADGSPDALAKLALLAGVDGDALAADGFRKAGGSWTFRGEALSRATMRRQRMLVCARCLSEDAAASPGSPVEAVHGRTVWMVEQVRTCPRHMVALTPLPLGSRRPGAAYDFMGRARTLLADLPRAADGALPRSPSRLEGYLLSRLAGRCYGGWLDGLPFHAAAVACEWIGAVALHGPHVVTKRFDEDDRRAAGDAGYEIASDGVAGLDAFSQGMRGLAGVSRAGMDGQKVFGHLWGFLQGKAGRAEAFEPVRRALAEFIAAEKPVAPGAVILGVPVAQRAVHSIRTGALETRLHAQTFRNLLEREKLLPEGHRAGSPGQVTIDMVRLADLMRRLERSINYADAMAYLNVPRHAAWAIYKAGLVAPRSRMDRGSHNRKLYLEFAREDLDAFLEALFAGAEARDAARDGEVGVQRAARENYCGVPEVVRLVLEGRLGWVGRLTGASGFMSVLVRSGEVGPLVAGVEPEGLTEGRVRSRLKAHHESVPILVAEGLLSAIEARHPRTRALQRYVTFASLERFEAAYATLTTRADEIGMPPNRLKARLAQEGVRPALPADRYRSAFYFRSDLPCHL